MGTSVRLNIVAASAVGALGFDEDPCEVVEESCFGTVESVAVESFEAVELLVLLFEQLITISKGRILKMFFIKIFVVQICKLQYERRNLF